MKILITLYRLFFKPRHVVMTNSQLQRYLGELIVRNLCIHAVKAVLDASKPHHVFFDIQEIIVDVELDLTSKRLMSKLYSDVEEYEEFKGKIVEIVAEENPSDDGITLTTVFNVKESLTRIITPRLPPMRVDNLTVIVLMKDNVEEVTVAGSSGQLILPCIVNFISSLITPNLKEPLDIYIKVNHKQLIRPEVLILNIKVEVKYERSFKSSAKPF